MAPMNTFLDATQLIEEQIRMLEAALTADEIAETIAKFSCSKYPG